MNNVVSHSTQKIDARIDARIEAMLPKKGTGEADPFLRKSLDHFRLPLPPSILLEGTEWDGGRSKDLGGATLHLLTPSQLDRNAFVPRNHRGSLDALLSRMEKAKPQSDRPSRAGELMALARRMIKGDLALTEDFQKQRLLAQPC